MVEHLPEEQSVGGSIPSLGTIILQRNILRLKFFKRINILNMLVLFCFYRGFVNQIKNNKSPTIDLALRFLFCYYKISLPSHKAMAGKVEIDVVSAINCFFSVEKERNSPAGLLLPGICKANEGQNLIYKIGLHNRAL